jgi:hypothetical protein
LSVLGDREDIRTMNNINVMTKQSSLPSVFAYSLIFPNYESLAQIRIDMYLLMMITIACVLVLTCLPFVWFQVSLSIVFFFVLVFACTLACLYQFHDLTFNFANSLWLFVLPIICLDTLIHASYTNTYTKWTYNRIVLSLIMSLVILYVNPIQSYVFLIIRNSLMYQSLICLVLVNLLLPACHYLLLKGKQQQQQQQVKTTPIHLTTSLPDNNQSLTDAIEIINVNYESSAIASS